MSENPLAGKTAVVTGASAGVGAAGARGLAALGATVAVVGRSPEKTAKVAEEIGAESYTVDFSRLADVRALAGTLIDRYPRIDILVNNAGLQMMRPSRTEDGFETTFQVNYMAPFLLTNLLFGPLGESEDARVISTSSAAHAFGRINLDDLGGAPQRYSPTRVYGASKLGNIVFTRELARRMRGTSTTASSFHPGPVGSDFFRDHGTFGKIARSRLARTVMISPEQGAQPLIHLATVADPQSVNALYFHRGKPREPKGRQATDQDFARRLWDRTAELVKL
jgi:NAD(P)-dependent dehydrogenase (short-subunit alcohol dehydrogenase family)